MPRLLLPCVFCLSLFTMNIAAAEETPAAAPVVQPAPPPAEPATLIIYNTLILGPADAPTGCLWQMPASRNDTTQIHSALSVTRGDDAALVGMLQFAAAYQEGAVLQSAEIIDAALQTKDSNGLNLDSRKLAPAPAEPGQTLALMMTPADIGVLIDAIQINGASMSVNIREAGLVDYKLPPAPEAEAAQIRDCIGKLPATESAAP